MRLRSTRRWALERARCSSHGRSSHVCVHQSWEHRPAYVLYSIRRKKHTQSGAQNDEEMTPPPTAKVLMYKSESKPPPTPEQRAATAAKYAAEFGKRAQPEPEAEL